MREYHKKYQMTPKFKKYKKEWNKKNRYKYQKEYDKKHPIKVKARREVKRAIEKGIIKRGICEGCGIKPKKVNGTNIVHAHHSNYFKPLYIKWLCFKCHRKV